MIITVETLERFNACEPGVAGFSQRFPGGFDIAPLWGTDEEASDCWREILSDSFLKRQVGWAISVGLLPARIRADLFKADLCGADLYRANLRGADLRGADLRWANLYRANLRGADLRWADGFTPPAMVTEQDDA